ncbi:MAG: hypothetical protein ACKO23_07465, partial [Gemmataceae bacterium]
MFLALAFSNWQTTYGAEANPIVLCGESRNVSARLEEIKRTIQENKNEQVAQMILALIESSKNELSPVDNYRSVATRTLVQSLLMRAPELTRIAFLQRLEKETSPQVKPALSSDDSEKLLKIFQEQFPSKKGMDCLDYLGNRSFAEGRMDEAQDFWRMISPWDMPEEGKTDPAFREFPGLDSSLNARIQAKQLLAR